MKLRFWAVFKPEMTLSLLHIVHNTSKYTFLPQIPKLAADQMSSLLPVCIMDQEETLNLKEVIFDQFIEH